MDQRRLLYWCGDAWKEHLFYVSISLIVVRDILRVVHRHSGDKRFSPVVLAWEAFWKVTLIAPWVASEASKVLMVRNCSSVWDAIRSTPGTSPPHLCGRTGRDEYSTCVGNRQTKPDQGSEVKGCC